MAKFQDLFGNFLFVALLIFAGLSFVIVVQSNNSAGDPISNNDIFGEASNNLSSTLENLEGTSGIQYDQFTGEQPKTGFGSIVLFGIVSFGKTFGNIIMTTLTVMIKLPLLVLGIPTTVVSVIITWAIIAIVISSWLLYKLGG